MKITTLLLFTLGLFHNASAQFEEYCGGITIPEINTKGCTSESVLDSITLTKWDAGLQEYDHNQTAIYNYDVNVQFLNYEIYFFHNSEPIGQYAHVYNSSKQLSAIEYYSLDNNNELAISQRLDITYDGQDRIIQVEAINVNLTIPGDTLFQEACTCLEYNEDNFPTKKESSINSRVRNHTNYEYDNKNKVTSRQTFILNDSTSNYDILDSYSEYDYANDLLQSRSNYFFDSDLKTHIVVNKRSYEYDEDSNLKKYTFQVINRQNVLEDRFRIEYEHNECGTLAQSSYFYFDTIDDSWREPEISTYHYSISTGTEDFEQQSFSVYPNPTTGTISIDNAELNDRKIEIYNSLGKKVKTISHRNGDEINLSELVSGSYYLRVKTSESLFTSVVYKI